MKNSLITVVAIVALGVGGFAVARYVRRAGGAAAPGPAPMADAGPKPTVKLVKNPVSVPDLELKTLDGRTLHSRDWKGKVTLVNFWATWCPPCREEIPGLIQLQERYKDHLLIVGVSSDEPGTDVAKFAADHKMNYPIVMETDALRKVFTGIFALPTTFVIDQSVKMVQKHIGLLNPALVEQETRVLAKLDTAATVEWVEDSGQVLLPNAGQATDVPGLALDTLKPTQKIAALKRLNEEQCTCGCGLTLAQCRINDPSCTISLPIAKQVVADAQKSN